MEGYAEGHPNTAAVPSTPLSAGTTANKDNLTILVEEDGDNCRICRGEGTTDQPLFYPCKCSGSIRYVHQDCLMEWLAHSQKKYCELCKTAFTFTKLYDNSMPSTLPWTLFLQQVLVHGVEALLRNTRYVMVTLVWLCWLPWSIRQVWRGLFWLADGSWVSKARLQQAALSELASVIDTGENTTIPDLTTTRVAQVISAQMQMQTSLFSGFVGLFTGDFLLVELAKLVFPSLTRWSQEFVSSDVADDPVILLTMDRQPSLLSGVGFVSSLTKYRLINGALVDILEGQLLCLLVVVAFILVFLIREWVINQQPIANMPDPDNIPVVAGAGNVQDDAARAARRRRRALRRANQNEDAPDAPVPEAGARPVAIPHPRHRRNLAIADALRDSQAQQDSERIYGRMEMVLARHYTVLRLYLTCGTAQPPRPNRSRDKLLRLSLVRLFELSTDVVDELQRRQASLSLPGQPGHAQAPPFLQHRADLSEKRNQTRQKLFSLRTPQFRDLSTDIFCELERRFPHFQEMQDNENTPASSLAEATQNTAILAYTQNDAESSVSRTWVDEDEGAEFRPLLPTRGAFDNTTRIEHDVEDRSLKDIDLPNHHEKPEVADETWIWDDEPNDNLRDTSSSSQIIPQISARVNADAAGMGEPSKEATVEDMSYSYISPVITPSMSTEYVPQEISSMIAEASDGDSEQRLDVEGESNLPLPNLAITIDQIDNSSAGDNDSAAINTPTTPTEESTTDDVDASTPTTRSVLDKLFDWFWHFDEDLQDQLAAIPALIHIDHEHLIDNAAAQAPFIPVHNHDQDHVELPALEAAPAVPAQEPNMLFGVDLNNPDAMEDAEDLDGILELIGMQGPLAGMVQNVIFSEFLITLTIATSVWLPYIWGKIALLIIANPVGVFVRAPLFLASKLADFALDLLIFITGLLTLSIASSVKAVTSLAGGTLSQWHMPDFVDKLSSDITKASGTRLENSLSNAINALKPDLPTFSLRSHYALVTVQQQLQDLLVGIGSSVAKWLRYPVQLKEMLVQPMFERRVDLQCAIDIVASFPKQMTAVVLYISAYVREGFHTLNHPASMNHQLIDVGLARWNAQDKVLAIILGYLFFACIGYLYLSIARFILGLQSDEKVEGIVADSLRQSGGVIKVMVIIGIEMLVFPLYCGLLLDAALMPLFEGVTLQTRLAFMLRAPITALFVHWFIGTCYMFHFALFVSMCRKIFRKGVLYFIRDPDDPNFHPVRDVLERPVLTQLGKIAFSGFIYGGLVYLCLGGVVYVLSCIRGILPIHWSTSQPQLAFPVDIIFYNFLLPFILRKARPSKKVAAMYEWWFRTCARALRLTNFLFGEDRLDERGIHSGRTLWSRLYSQGLKFSAFPAEAEVDSPLTDSNAAPEFVRDGRYVLAPASDSVRIPKGHRVFLEVNDKNERSNEEEKGMQGSTDDHFTRVYVPPSFRPRITAFIVLLWFFAASTGVAFTIGPLLIGRAIIRPLASGGIPPNDLYALTIGLHVCGAGVYVISYYPKVKAWVKEYTTSFWARLSFYLYPALQYLLGLVYLGSATCVLPIIFSLLAELYIHIPLYEYLTAESELPELPESSASHFMTLPPTIFLLQTWTVGLVLVRVVLREGLGDPETSRPARAIKAITQRGYLHPNVGLATRALLLPAALLASVLWFAPLALGRLLNAILEVDDARRRATIYRYSYPGLAGMVMSIFIMHALKRRITMWRMKIRDEIYLIGERLHNYQEARESRTKGNGNPKVRSERVEVG